MTGQAFRIVGSRSPYDIVMRVVACDATHPPIPSVVALTVGHPVWLKADINLSAQAVPHDALPGTMALAAEIRDLLRGKQAKLLRSRICFSLRDRLQMTLRAEVAALALDAWDEAFELEAIAGHGVCGVALEARLGLKI